jgi:hypothetical protein
MMQPWLKSWGRPVRHEEIRNGFSKRRANATQRPFGSADAVANGAFKNYYPFAAEGKLVVAGPFMDNQPIRGIFIFNVESVDEAKQANRYRSRHKGRQLVMELHPWYCSAALMEGCTYPQQAEKKALPTDAWLFMRSLIF